MSSIVNQPTGGGPKKAGLPPTMSMLSSRWIAYNKTGSGADGLLNLTNMRTNRFKTDANQNLPIGFNRNITMR
jgi:hypothetical protein